MKSKINRILKFSKNNKCCEIKAAFCFVFVQMTISPSLTNTYTYALIFQDFKNGTHVIKK